MKSTYIADAYRLNELLVKKYGERLQTDPLLSLSGSIQGTLDSKFISISFKGNEYLLVSTKADSKDVLDELFPVLKEVMGNELPICSYDLQSNGLELADALPTIEWDIVAPDKRIKEIVNGRAFSDGAKIHKLRLYNGKNINTYIETAEEKEARIKNAKIYGIYPGSIQDVEAINNLSELDLFFAIDALGAHLWRCRHDMAHGRIVNVDLTMEQYALEYMVYQTKKFGVELPEPVIDKHVQATESYNKWFQFYSNHFKKVLTDKEWKEFEKARKNGEDISSFMPEGHWNDLLDKPVMKELK